MDGGTEQLPTSNIWAPACLSIIFFLVIKASESECRVRLFKLFLAVTFFMICGHFTPFFRFANFQYKTSKHIVYNDYGSIECMFVFFWHLDFGFLLAHLCFPSIACCDIPVTDLLFRISLVQGFLFKLNTLCLPTGPGMFCSLIGKAKFILLNMNLWP